jgi:OPT family oligopeptide transporter
VGIIPALLLLSVSSAHPHGEQLPPVALAAWIACIAALGVTIAIPIKRQLIDRERLAFPSGTAAAIMLHGLHELDRASATAVKRTRLLAAAVLAGAILPLLRDLRGHALIPASSKLFDWLPRVWAGGQRHVASETGLVVDHSLLLVAAGAFVGLRTAAWMFAGGLVTAFVLGPHAVETVAVDAAGHAGAAASSLRLAWAEVGIWAGAPMLVAYALVALVGQARAFARFFAARELAPATDPRAAAIEIPRAWFWIGFAVCGSVAIVLGAAVFAVPVVLGALAVALSVAFGMVACRITGETDINPGGPMGKLTQLAFGAMRPQHPATNLMTAAMTHASSTASADLLNDLKAGYLLGANPRKQFFAQLIGIAAGSVASVTAYYLLIPDARALVGEPGQAPAFAAPAAHQFRAIAELLQYGLANLPTFQRTLVVIGAVAGLGLALIERATPARIARWMPSTAGLGLGLLLPVSTSLAMVLGAAIATLVARRSEDAGERIVWPVSAGLLAGESLAGVLVVAANHLLT